MEDDAYSCSKGSCKGWNRCIGGVWTGCVYTGESTESCSVCGRRGYRYCSEAGNLESTSCSAFGVERCNACDDNGNGSVDEGLNGTACTMDNGCSGVTLCTATFTVATHSDSQVAWLQRGAEWVSVSHRSLARYIKGSGWSGEKIFLVACDSGACSRGLAQNLSNKLGVEVLAPQGKAVLMSNGTVQSSRGVWQTFFPGGGR
jgi:hypothetical protein